MKVVPHVPGAGVRKPPKGETALRNARLRRRSYRDLRAAGEVYD